MTFREMTVEDLEQVVEIENRLFSDPWTKEGFFTFLTNVFCHRRKRKNTGLL